MYVPATQGVTASVSAPLWQPMPRPAVMWACACPGEHQTSAVSRGLPIVLKGGPVNEVGGSLYTFSPVLDSGHSGVHVHVRVRVRVCMFIHMCTHLYIHVVL